MTVIKLPKVIKFEWDNANEKKNWDKHKVTAKEAGKVFLDKKTGQKKIIAGRQ